MGIAIFGLVIWVILGVLNLSINEEIRKLDYFLVWICLILELIIKLL